MASELAEKILTYLEVKGETDTILLSNEFKTDHQKVIGAVNSLHSLGDVSELCQYLFAFDSWYFHYKIRFFFLQ